ncbi:MAG: hypothetical protein HKN57_06505 [Xanthomonadales bacterium]|nr:hypothetical protein [Gammaproteobacteria bacterium]MBT8052270.1 hypothetical protein [Gammaproteobacteria bacterium]NND56883.1 hypothetical protein [Xanthomonadales bacterium]NNK97598.1 hypothetical protein [Xanthomonadales bacterium]
MNHGNKHVGNFYGVENLAYYGDWNSNRVFFEIQVNPLGKTRSLNLNSFPEEGAYLLMGSFVWGDKADDGGM